MQSELSCPDPAEISANVQKLVDLSDESAQKLRATARRDGSWLVLSLAESDQTSLGEQRVAFDGDCTMLARTAAVVFATWISNEHPEFLVALPPDGRQDGRETTTGAAPPAATASTPGPPAALPSATGSGPSSTATEPAARAIVSATNVPNDEASRTRPRGASERRFVLGAGLGGVANSSSLAPALALSAAWDPGQRGFGARASLNWLAERTAPLGSGEVRWIRWPLRAGPLLRVRAGRSSLDLEAGLVAGWTRMSGHKFTGNSSDSGVTFGTYAGLHFVPERDHLHLFIDAAPLFWFREATAVATDANGATISRKLPSFEVLFTVGAELPL